MTDETIVGHSNPAMTRHYTHVSEAAATSAVASLPSIMGGEVKSLPALPPATTAQPGTIPLASVLAIADKLTGKNWRTVKEELLSLTHE
jgi:hypothetical protein